MKPAWEWTEEDLQQLITTPVRESITLDYKRCEALQRTDGKIKEISKDVSAFANSAGGTIVYGIIENKNVPTEFDLGFDPLGAITKEWLEQVITSNVQRRIEGVLIHPIDTPNVRPGRLVLLVSVPQSKRAPHMANDYRYYKRYNFESVPMQEYEVRDISRRQDGPDLKVKLSLRHSGPEPRPVAVINTSISNDSPVVAEHAVVGLMVDARLTILKWGHFSPQTEPLISDVSTYDLQSILATYGAGVTDMPIWWKGPQINLEPIQVSASSWPTDADYRLISFISAPAMENKLESYVLSTRSGAFSLTKQ